MLPLMVALANFPPLKTTSVSPVTCGIRDFAVIVTVTADGPGLAAEAGSPRAVRSPVVRVTAARPRHSLDMRTATFPAPWPVRAPAPVAAAKTRSWVVDALQPILHAGRIRAERDRAFVPVSGGKSLPVSGGKSLPVSGGKSLPVSGGKSLPVSGGK